jgi:uncharacterized protein (TIGR02300 family)
MNTRALSQSNRPVIPQGAIARETSTSQPRRSPSMGPSRDLLREKRFPLAKPELGTKRLCQSCSAKFYDLQKDPIICPKCSTVFVPAIAAVRPEIAAKATEDDDADVGVAAEGPELVSLEDVEAEESGKDLPIDDVEIEDDIEEDETFLEEEEEGEDDVADLIDGDLEDDEES